MIKAFGVDVGGTNLKFGAFDENGVLAEKWIRTTDAEDGGDRIIPDIAGEIGCFMKENNVEEKDIVGIGLGIPGPVDGNGHVRSCVNLHWNDFDPAKELRKFYRTMDIAVENDANAAAFGEYCQGAGKRYRTMMLVTLGTGGGGGIVADGHIWRGAHGIAGEIGHIPSGIAAKTNCNCGKRGCIDQFASATGIVRVMKEILLERGLAPEEYFAQDVTAKTICQMANKGDLLAKRCLDICLGALGRGLAVFSNAFDPEEFIIGGGVSGAGELIIPIIESAYRENLSLTDKGADIRCAALGNDAGVTGAGNLVLARRKYGYCL